MSLQKPPHKIPEDESETVVCAHINREVNIIVRPGVTPSIGDKSPRLSLMKAGAAAAAWPSSS